MASRISAGPRSKKFRHTEYMWCRFERIWAIRGRGFPACLASPILDHAVAEECEGAWQSVAALA